MLEPQEETPAPVETAAGVNRSLKPDPSAADPIQKEQRDGSWSDDKRRNLCDRICPMLQFPP